MERIFLVGLWLVASGGAAWAQPGRQAQVYRVPAAAQARRFEVPLPAMAVARRMMNKPELHRAVSPPLFSQTDGRKRYF